uniref:claudin-19-like n=1 Tax=Styela clava TaxID=7725 RepID=UPI00193A0D3F|nr:claudin-19-like [Styela clava]
MAKKPIYYASLALNVLGHYGLLVATGIPYWRKSSWQVSDPLYGRIPTFDGLWWQCMSLKTGGFTCSNYGMPTLYVDAGIQACRGLMTTACVLTFFGLIINMLVVDCSNILGNGTKAKRSLTLAAGAMILVSWLCTLGATSFYAWQVTYQFYNPYYQEREFKYEYGPCLYVAWVSMAFLLISGCILFFGACKDKGDDEYDGYRYRTPRETIPSSAFDDHRKTDYV